MGDWEEIIIIAGIIVIIWLIFCILDKVNEIKLKRRKKKKMNKCEEIKEIKCAIYDLNERLKVLENEENKKWVPGYKEEYWFAQTDTMNRGSCKWDNDSLDNLRLRQNRIFRTEDEAEDYLEYLEEKQKYMNTFTQEEWKSRSILKYGFYCDTIIERIEKDSSCFAREINKPYFRTETERDEFVKRFENQILHEMGIE